MAQIAHATGIPAEGVVRTLGTKDAIVLKVAEDMLGSVVKALADIDPQTPLVEALMAAHSTLLADIAVEAGPVTGSKRAALHRGTETRSLARSP